MVELQDLDRQIAEQRNVYNELKQNRYAIINRDTGPIVARINEAKEMERTLLAKIKELRARNDYLERLALKVPQYENIAAEIETLKKLNYELEIQIDQLASKPTSSSLDAFEHQILELETMQEEIIKENNQLKLLISQEQSSQANATPQDTSQTSTELRRIQREIKQLSELVKSVALGEDAELAFIFNRAPREKSGPLLEEVDGVKKALSELKELVSHHYSTNLV